MIRRYKALVGEKGFQPGDIQFRWDRLLEQCWEKRVGCNARFFSGNVSWRLYKSRRSSTHKQLRERTLQDNKVIDIPCRTEEHCMRIRHVIWW